MDKATVSGNFVANYHSLRSTLSIGSELESQLVQGLALETGDEVTIQVTIARTGRRWETCQEKTGYYAGKGEERKWWPTTCGQLIQPGKACTATHKSPDDQD